MSNHKEYVEVQYQLLSAWDTYYQNTVLKLLGSQHETQPVESKCAGDCISDLKKRIKYAKTPMERQMLNKKLNAAYKELKTLKSSF